MIHLFIYLLMNMETLTAVILLSDRKRYGCFNLASVRSMNRLFCFDVSFVKKELTSLVKKKKKTQEIIVR